MKIFSPPGIGCFGLVLAIIATIALAAAPKSVEAPAPHVPIQCSHFATCGGCIEANRELMSPIAGSPIRDVCQWCRVSGKCFNSTEASLPPTAPAESSSAIKADSCNLRCTIKSLDMCPPLDLACGAKAGCIDCANRSFCDFCDSTGACFNPCGDEKKPPQTAPQAASPLDEPTQPIASPTYNDIPMEESTSEPDASRWERNTFPLLEQCDSCIWSTIGQCKVAEYCASLSGCSACTANPSCGWCGNNVGGKCVAADVNHRPCSGLQCKYWSYGNCEASCNSHGDCGDCIADQDAKCSWCAGGTLNGRKTSYCGTTSILHQCQASFTTECPGCSQLSNCSKCLGKPNCGYCAFSNPVLSSCVEGNKQGPYDPSDCSNSPDPAVGWIQSCQAWNATVPPPKPAPEAPIAPPTHTPHQPPPVTVPASHPPSPVEPPVLPPVLQPPSTPPSTPVHAPTPTHQPTSPHSPPIAPPKAAPTAPSHNEPNLHPDKRLEPYVKEIHRTYNIGIIVGASVTGAVVIFGGILWFKLHASATHRYRAIG